MPTRKQEKRDRKRRVHGLERGPAPQAPRDRPERTAATKAKPARGGRTPRARRSVPYPTWRRAFMRSAPLVLIYLVLMVVTARRSLITLAPMLVFILLSPILMYAVDRFAWRSARKRNLPHDPPPPGVDA